MTDDRSDRVAGSGHGVTLDPEVLLWRRRELGLTQEALGALAGLTDRTIRSAERRRPLSIASARLLAAARVAAERAAALQLVRLLGGVPRSLQIAGRVLERERYTRLAAVPEGTSEPSRPAGRDLPREPRRGRSGRAAAAPPCPSRAARGVRAR